MEKNRRNPGKIFLTAALSVFLLFGLSFSAVAQSEGQLKIFFVDPNYDGAGRGQVQAQLEKISGKAYFYLEKKWVDNLSAGKKQALGKTLDILAREFDEKIFPRLTAFYGNIWSPGIDNDRRITILFFQTKPEVAGYFNTADEYEKIQSPGSNEREMIYLNIGNIFSDIMKSYIAHEFTHLIVFNQKDRLRGVSEETWLNEARADFSPTYLGYDSDYSASNLRQRVKTFIENTHDSLTEWQSLPKDYGVVSMVIQYLADYYGAGILADSLRSSKIGVDSLDEALKKEGAGKTFEQIFSDWLITAFLNDCGFGSYYCYKNKNLGNIRIIPSLIFLPSRQRSRVSLNYSIKKWSGNWYRILGGRGELRVAFRGDAGAKFSVYYVLCQNSSFCRAKKLELDETQRADLVFDDFSKHYTSLTLIPWVVSSENEADGNNSFFNFSLEIASEDKNEEELINQLKRRISELRAQIAFLQAKIAAVSGRGGRPILDCKQFRFGQNLYFGMNNSQVLCLQKFLSSQGPDIYPGGIVSGWFGPLTRAAVIRFQEKFAAEILSPLGLNQGTGFVGSLTRSKINQILLDSKD